MGRATRTPLVVVVLGIASFNPDYLLEQHFTELEAVVADGKRLA